MKIIPSHSINSDRDARRPRVIIVGGGFGGLYAAKSLGNAPVEVLLIDRRNFHLFQPLLYQVATGGLSPGDIASPLRAVLNKYRNIRVIKGEVVDIDPAGRLVQVRRPGTGDLEAFSYNYLIVGVGVRHHYFGNEEWCTLAPGLKTIEDALEIRKRIFTAFEEAEWERDPDRQRALMTFVVVGGGPTGVELAGALAELSHFTLKKDFRNIDPTRARILLIEAGERILPTYPPGLSRKAQRALERLGVTVMTHTLVADVQSGQVRIRRGEREETVPAGTVLWAAGVRGAPMGHILAEKTGATQDPLGRIKVESDLSIPGHPEIMVIGDLAHFAHQTGEPLPGIAPVAMQQGRYAARRIKALAKGKRVPPFRYFDKGSLAVIGRNAAVADLGRFKLSGWIAWVLWVFIHIAYLIEFDNK
ncbi:MAG: NAD(P)/FAD-dependent oxidoreductase, partial [Calditrichaeota bacterium]